MYVGDRDTYNDVFCVECGNIADKETLSNDGLCDECLYPSIDKISIKTELSIEQAVKLYNALNPIGQRDFFGNLSNNDAKTLQRAIRDNHKDIDGSCVCFACSVWIE